MWKGPIRFGLVNVPVRLYSATDSLDISFHQVHRDCGGSIKYKRVCAGCGDEVQFEHIDKGYRQDKNDEQTILTKEDLAGLPLASLHTIEVLNFIDPDKVAIDIKLFDRHYYVEPGDKAALKPFKLFQSSMVADGLAAVVKVSLRQREHLALLQTFGDYFVLTTLLWHDEVRNMEIKNTTDEIAGFTLAEVNMARSLIRGMQTTTFDPSDHEDSYRVALHQLIDSKREGRPTLQQALEEAPDAATDLLALLTASVEKAKQLRS